MKSLIEALAGERVVSEHEINKVKVKFQSLTSEEIIEIESKLRGIDIITQSEEYKIFTLSRSLVSIDGIPIQSYPEVITILETAKKENRIVKVVDAVEQAIKVNDSETIKNLFFHYTKVVKEKQDKIEELKKV